MLKLIYVFFLGLLLTIFVGLGISAFYQAPEPPPYPPALERPMGPDHAYTEEQLAADWDWNQKLDGHNEQLAAYNRNVSMIVLGFAVLFVVLSLTLHSRIGVMADGLLLAGVLTLLYSIARSFAAEDVRYSFMVVAAGLVITMVLGYLKFMKSSPAPARKKK